MFIYNVTINIDDSVHDQWLVWMRDEHIPHMLSTGKFLSAKMCKVLIDEDMGGTTYSIQYLTESKETLQRYYDEDAATLRAEGQKRFADKFVAFRTELQLVNVQTV